MSDTIIPDDEYQRMRARIERWAEIEAAARRVVVMWDRNGLYLPSKHTMPIMDQLREALAK